MGLVAAYHHPATILKINPHPFGMRLDFEGLSHGLTKCPPDTLLPCLRQGRPFESQLEHEKIRIPKRVSGFFGASVLIGLFEKESDTNGF